MVTMCISKEDCNLLLANFANCEFSTFSMEPFNKETRGYLGEHLLLKLNVKSEDKVKELSFFVKTLLKCEGLNNVFDDGNFFEKEVFVYKFANQVKRLIPSTPIDCMPKMYYYTKDETIILENLRNSDYKGCSSHKFDEQHMMKAIVSLAKFHAISFAFQELRSKELKRKYEICEEYSQYLNGFFRDNVESAGYKFIQSGLHGALALVDLVYGNDELLKKRLTDFRPTFLERLNKPNKAFRRVICHGDLWGNNMVFKYNNSVPVDCKLVDFQMISYLPPAFDVTMLLYHASPKELYQKYVHNYYDFYYKSLSDELSALNIDISEVYPLQEYQASCREYMPCNKYLWLCYRQSTESKHGNCVSSGIDTDQLRDNLLGKEGRISFVQDNFFSDGRYKSTLSDILEDNRLTYMGDLITVEDCFKAISSKIGSNNYRLINWELKKFDYRSGILGEHYYLTTNIIFEGNEKELHFFVKLSPQVDNQRQFMAESGMSFKEMQFFNRIIPDFNALGIRCLEDAVPRCHLAEVDILIQDDLKELGYKIHRIRDGISAETLKCSVSALAKLHASGIIFEEKRKVRLNEFYPKEFIEAFYNNSESAVNIRKSGIKGHELTIKMFSNYTSNLTPETFLEMIINLLNSQPQLILPSTKYRNTICHGDSWCNNVLIKDTSNCILVDFQSYRYGPPAFDLMQHLYFSTSRKSRSLHLQMLLDHYYSEFKSIIESHGCDVQSILTYEDFIQCCESSKTFAILQTSCYYHNITLPAESIEAMMLDEEYFNKSMYVDRSEHIALSCKNDPIYKSCLEDITIELRELCEKIVSKNK